MALPLDFIPTLDLVISENISTVKNGRVTLLNGSYCSIEKFIANHLPLNSTILTSPTLYSQYFVTKSESKYINDLVKEISHRFLKVKLPTTSLDSSSVIEYLTNLTPVVDLEDDKDIILFDTKLRVVTSYSFGHWVAYRGLKVSEARNLISPAIFTFEPWILEPIFNKVLNGVPTPHVNFYNPPAWRHKNVTPKIPKIIGEFLHHLFPSPEVRKYIYHWLYNLIVKRNQTYLCLVGARGVGKNIFAEELCGALIGLEHFEKVGDSLLEDKFNAPLKNKRLIILDEVEVDQDRKVNRLKAFGNDMIPIESKGKDSKKEKNYNSFIIATNSLDGMKFGPEERRFSIPEINETKLDSVWSLDKISNLITELRNPESQIVADFGNWILENGKILERDEFYCYKGPYFFEVLRVSMVDWQKCIVEEITSMKKKLYYIKDIKRLQYEFLEEEKVNPRESTKQYFPRGDSPKLTVFIKNYLHKGVSRLGTLEKVFNEEKRREEWAIIPSAEFMPDVEYTEVDGNYSGVDV